MKQYKTKDLLNPKITGMYFGDMASLEIQKKSQDSLISFDSLLEILLETDFDSKKEAKAFLQEILN